jgi:hypothetical protein
MSSNFKPLRLIALTFALVAPLAWAAELPRIAVTDLSYEEKVSEYFSYIDINEKYDKKGSSRERSSDTARVNAHSRPVVAIKSGLTVARCESMLPMSKVR